MKKPIIYTDCSGGKLGLINLVSHRLFNDISVNTLDCPDLKTPLSIEEMFETTRARLDNLANNKAVPDLDGVYLVTIQRGFFFDGMFWHLFAAAGVTVPGKIQSLELSTSIQLPTQTSVRKQQNIDLNIKDLLLEEFPNWDVKQTSVYTLLTGKREFEWLRAPLDNAIMVVSR